MNLPPQDQKVCLVGAGFAARRVAREEHYREARRSYYAAYRVGHKVETHARYLAHKEAHLAYYQTHREEVLAYRRANKEQVRASVERCAARIKLEVFNAYGGPRCACCGETLLQGLGIDHINGDGAGHRKQTPGTGTPFYYWLRRHNYPSGFQVLCATCNVAKGTSDHCPHKDLRL